MERIEILGTQIDNVSWEEALERIREMIRQGGPHQVITPAIQQVIQARRDPGFRHALRDADLVVADGMPVVFASRWHKTPLKDRITGVDLVPEICRMAAQEGYTVFFFGAEEGVAAETARRMQERFPDLRIAGSYSPPRGFMQDPEENEKALQAVQGAAPQILFTALSSPAQEKWLHRHRACLGVPLMIGVGGAFNMITGREKRAPGWIQRLGMEGLYRFAQRPREIGRRIVLNVPYFFLLLFDRLTYRTQKRLARWLRPLILGAGDALLAPAAFLFSYWFYFRSGVFNNAADPFAEHPSLLNMPAYSDLLMVVSLLGVASLWFFRLYERNKYMTFQDLFVRLLKTSLTAVFLLIGFQFLFFKHLFAEYNFRGFSRVVFGFFGIGVFGAWLGWRWGFTVWEKWLHRTGLNLDRILIVGASPATRRIAESMLRHPEWGNHPLGVVCPEGEAMDSEGPIPFLGTIRDLQRLLPARKVDEILVADPGLPMPGLLDVVRLCREHRVRLSIIPSIHELLGVSSEIKRMGEYRVITVSLDRSAGDWAAPDQETRA